jgi:hypothetical protein
MDAFELVRPSKAPAHLKYVAYEYHMSHLHFSGKNNDVPDEHCTIDGLYAYAFEHEKLRVYVHASQPLLCIETPQGRDFWMLNPQTSTHPCAIMRIATKARWYAYVEILRAHFPCGTRRSGPSILSLLVDVARSFGCKIVGLHDQSHIPCDARDAMSLQLWKLVTTGQTWYETQGFQLVLEPSSKLPTAKYLRSKPYRDRLAAHLKGLENLRQFQLHRFKEHLSARLQKLVRPNETLKDLFLRLRTKQSVNECRAIVDLEYLPFRGPTAFVAFARGIRDLMRTASQHAMIL